MLQGPNWLSGGVGGDFRLVERKGAVGGRSVRSKGLACPDGHQKGNRTDARFYSFPIWELRGCFPYSEMASPAHEDHRSQKHRSLFRDASPDRASLPHWLEVAANPDWSSTIEVLADFSKA